MNNKKTQNINGDALTLVRYLERHTYTWGHRHITVSVPTVTLVDLTHTLIPCNKTYSKAFAQIETHLVSKKAQTEKEYTNDGSV